MENYANVSLHKKTYVRALSFLVIALIGTASAWAYDQNSTHPILTDEIIQFYNNTRKDGTYPSISVSQASWIRRGSIREDGVPRWINHFFDPIHNKGWDGGHYGGFSKEYGYNKGTQIPGASAPMPAISSKEWVVNQEYQAAYGAQYGNQTWQRAISEYLNGNEEEAFVALGHVLHLIEDAGVPDHTRGDSHPGIEGDPGSPLESYAKNLTDTTNLQYAESLTATNISPYIFTNIQSAIEHMALYSNRNFFSEDTISNKEFDSPSASTTVLGYFKTVLSDGSVRKIAKYNGIYVAYVVSEDEFGYNKLLSTNDANFVMPSYVNHLFPEILRSGAGAIELFFLEAAKQYYGFEIGEPIVADRKVSLTEWFGAKIMGAAISECDTDSCKKITAPLISIASKLLLSSQDQLRSSTQQFIPTSSTPYTPTAFKPPTGTISTAKSTDSDNIVFGTVASANPEYYVDTNNLTLPFVTNTTAVKELGEHILPDTDATPGTAGYSSTLYAMAPASLAGVLDSNDKSLLSSALAGIGIDKDPTNAAATAILLTTALAGLGYTVRPRIQNGEAVFDIVKTVPRTIYESIKNTATVLIPVTKQVVEYVSVQVSETFLKPVQVLKTVVGSAYQWVQEAVPVVKQVARTVYDYVTSWVPQSVTSWIGGIWQTVTNWVERVVPIAKTVYDTVIETAYQWVRRPVEYVRQVMETVYEAGVRLVTKTVPVVRDVVEYISQPIASVYERAKTVYDDVFVGTVQAQQLLSVAAQTPVVPEIPPVQPPSTPRVPPNLFRNPGNGMYWMLSGGLSDFANGNGGVARYVSDQDRVREIFAGATIRDRWYGEGSSGWTPQYGGGTSGGAMTLDAIWRQLPEVFTYGTAAQAIDAYAKWQPGTGHQMGWAWKPVEMIDPKTNIIYSVDFTEDVRFQDTLGWRRTDTGLYTAEQLNNAIRSNETYDKLENFQAHKPYITNQFAPRSTGTGQPTAFQLYFQEQLAAGRTAEDILANNPYMYGEPLYQAPANTVLNTYTYFNVPFKEGLSQAQTDSIQNMLRTRANQGWGLNEIDAKNFAYATGVQNWQQFVNLSPNSALEISRPIETWNIGQQSAL